MTRTQHISNARSYFEYILKQPEPYTFLANIPLMSSVEPFFEEEWLDFKGSPQSDKDAKKIWSKALSGYANITDGLVIWGIDARKTPPREIDAASGLHLLPDPHAFESKLRDWIRDATNPPVMGVEYQTYTDGAKEGFVVCFIPESEHKPHRAEFADRHYYFRAGDDFLVAEPGLLRTLFYPQSRPHLWLETSLRFDLYPREFARTYQKSGDSYALNKLLNGSSSLHFSINLHNSGTATAKDVYIVVQASDELNYSPGVDWDIRANPQGQAAFQARRPIHPGEMIELCSGSFQRKYSNNSISLDDSITILPIFTKEYFRFLLYGDGMPKQEIYLEFIPDDMDIATCTAIKQGIPTI